MSVINQGGYAYIIHDSGNPGPLPLVIFLHGQAERGDGTATGIQNLQDFIDNPFINLVKGIDTGFILIAPQLPVSHGNWENHFVDAALDYALKVLPVKTDQITLMGVSLGGGGVLRWLSVPGNGAKLNCAIPICPAWAPDTNYKVIAESKCPLWFHHAEDDGRVNVSSTKTAVAEINKFNPAIPAYATIYPKGGHEIWGLVWELVKIPNVWQWMKQNTNIKHVAVTTTTAPPPVSTPIPTTLKAIAEVKNLTPTTATLDGSKSEGNPAYAIWDVLKYPPKARFDIWPNGWNKGGLVINVNNLSAGEYLFELTVGKQAALSKTTMAVTVGSVKAPIFKEFDIPTGAKHGIVREDKSVEFS